jgi:hypothetical protein
MDRRLAVETPPGYLRAAGAVVAIWFIGGTLLDYSALPRGSVTRSDFALALFGAVSGIGLAAGRRWAWFPTLILAVGGVVIGYFLVVRGPDITEPSAVTVAFVFVIAPSLLLLAALFAPRSWRWLWKRPGAVPVPVRPDDDPLAR